MSALTQTAEGMRDRLRFLRSATGAIGLALLALVLGTAVLGPFLAPHSPTESIGIPWLGRFSSMPALAKLSPTISDRNFSASMCRWCSAARHAGHGQL